MKNWNDFFRQMVINGGFTTQANGNYYRGGERVKKDDFTNEYSAKSRYKFYPMGAGFKFPEGHPRAAKMDIFVRYQEFQERRSSSTTCVYHGKVVNCTTLIPILLTTEYDQP